MHLNAFVSKHRLLLDVINEVASQVQLEDAVATLINGARQVLEADRVRFFLVDETMQNLKEVGNPTGEGRVLAFGEGHPGRVAKSGEQEADMTTEAGAVLEYYDTDYEPNVMLCVPVFDVSNALVAVIEASRKKDGPLQRMKSAEGGSPRSAGFDDER